MTNNGKSASGEIDMGRDLISPDLDCGEVVYILENPTTTETVHIHGDLDEIGTGLPPGSLGNNETAHIVGKIRLETHTPRRKGGLGMLPWML